MGEFAHAWQMWITGAHVEDLPLWGSDVHSWARVGKTAEFLAALVVIAELVGRQHLNRFGEVLKRLGRGQTVFWSRVVLSDPRFRRYGRSRATAPGLRSVFVRAIIPAAVVYAASIYIHIPTYILIAPIVVFALLGWFLAQGEVLRYIKIIGVVVLVGGFVLDLLAS
jgi:hypothetical protein